MLPVGYDLRFNDEESFRKLWGPHLPPDTIDELAGDIGRPGTRKRVKALRSMGIEIPFKSAWPVFIGHSLPRFHDDTRAVYPSMDALPDLCRSVLVSLVFNRGSSLKGSARKEMRAIRDILDRAAASGLSKQQRAMILSEVEDELISMQRLWGPGTGVSRRRQDEANLWREGLENG